jgi:hypothetical protein
MSKNYDDGFGDGFILGMLLCDDHHGKDGCYIATSVYGSYDCPEVWVLRRFRDYRLKQTELGRAFIKAYYAISPTLVKVLGRVRLIREMVRKPLDMFVVKLRSEGISDQPYEDGPNIWARRY